MIGTIMGAIKLKVGDEIYLNSVFIPRAHKIHFINYEEGRVFLENGQCWSFNNLISKRIYRNDLPLLLEVNGEVVVDHEIIIEPEEVK